MDEEKNDQNTKQDNPAGNGKTEKTAEEKLAECQKQAEEYLNNWKRERADLINYKKDEAKRLEEAIKFGNEALLLEIIEIADDLGAGVKHQPENEGIAQISRKLHDWMAKYGIEKIKVEGKKFNPAEHEAVEGSESEGDKLEEVRAGYTLYGKVIRPARVKINK
jgi:molecular chaperone GrpE